MKTARICRIDIDWLEKVKIGVKKFLQNTKKFLSDTPFLPMKYVGMRVS